VNGMWRDEDEKEKEVKGTKNLIGKTPRLMCRRHSFVKCKNQEKNH
jgi:hypothetical protein